MESRTLAAVFDEAERETRARIRQDMKGASPKVVELLKEISARLFSDFDAGMLRRERKPSKVVEAEFKKVTGLTIAAFIKEQRMRTATQLLETTNLPISVVAAHTGGVRVQGWSNAYTLWSGRQPSEVREQAEPLADVSEQRAIMFYLWWKVGELDSEQSTDLHAAALAQEGFCEPEELLAVEAQVLEETLEENGFSEADRICRRMPVSDEALFESLCKRSRESGRLNRRRGVELAEMALAAVEGNFERLGTEGPELLALAWAWLGNARRVASDLLGAEEAIGRGEVWLERAKKPPGAEAVILNIKGTLRLFQRRFAEALELLNVAAGLAEALGDSTLLVDVLLQRAATRGYGGDVASAIPDLNRAHCLIPESDKRRRMGSYQSQLMAFVQIGETTRARDLLPEARKLNQELDDLPSYLQLCWIEGLCFREDGNLDAAEPLLVEAHRGLLDLEDQDMQAIVSLELALLHQERGQTSEMVSRAAEALPALEALKLPEALGAHALLQKAILQRNVERSVLLKARLRLLCPGATNQT